MVRARYGTGVFLKLIKRNCEIRIRLTPCDCDFLRVHLRIGGDNHYFYPSCVMGSQFSAFLTAVYHLYEENNIKHTYWPRKINEFKHEYPYAREDQQHLITSALYWDEEGYTHNIIFKRHCPNDIVTNSDNPDPIQITIENAKTYEYTVDGRELCYAVAKGCTEALKKYGIAGYEKSTGMQYPGDKLDIEKLLFVKAYALNVMDARGTYELWANPNGWESAEASDFEKEMELLRFDM